jgi:selenide,water dikinase
VSAELWVERLPLLPGASELVRGGVVPGGTRRNLEHVAPHTEWKGEFAEWERLLIADAQTSGGLLIALPEAAVAGLVGELVERGTSAAAVVGRMTVGAGPSLVVRRSAGGR